jgi:hypothetical protein
LITRLFRRARVNAEEDASEKLEGHEQFRIPATLDYELYGAGIMSLQTHRVFAEVTLTRPRPLPNLLRVQPLGDPLVERPFPGGFHALPRLRLLSLFLRLLRLGQCGECQEKYCKEKTHPMTSPPSNVHDTYLRRT